MGFWLSWNVEDNVKMQVFVDNAAAGNKESPVGGCVVGGGPVGGGGGGRECPVVRHGAKRKLEEEEEETRGGNKTKNSRVYVVHRQSIFNISVCKLNRYRQTPDPSLRRSVLICNTLRTIEREMVAEGLSPGPPLALLPSIEETITLDPIPPPPPTNDSTPPSVEAVPSTCRDNEPLGYEKNLTDLDSVSGRATPYPSTINSNNNNADLNQSRSDDRFAAAWDSSSPSSSSSAACDRVTTATISWSSVLSFPSQNELVTTSSSGVSEDVWPSSGGGGVVYMDEVSSGAEDGGGPNTSPSASSDSGISTASDEIFGDIDLSLYDFDLVPLSPPNTARAAPPSAEELLRSFPPAAAAAAAAGQSIHPGSASVLQPFNRHSRSYVECDNEFDHVMPAPP